MLISIIFSTILFLVGIFLGASLKILFLKRKIEFLEKETLAKKREAERVANKILSLAKKETQKQSEQLKKKEEALLRKEREIREKFQQVEKQEKEILEKKAEIEKEIEKISGIKKEQAKEKIISQAQEEAKKDILERLQKLEREGEEMFQKRAKEILTFAIQRLALPVTQEITITTLFLPSPEIRGKIIGKEGRNIRTLEKLTGVEIILDEETPEVVTLSCFDPIRRQIAKLALEKLIKDGRIQPAKIEEKVKEAEKEIDEEIKKAGEAACLEVGFFGLDPKLIKLLGRLKFRSSFGQNVLLHSLEVAFLAEALANEIGVNSRVCKMAGLFHDIGKAMDHLVSGSHTQIGMKILEKFGVEKEIISAMKSHHEEFPPESLEAILVQVADQISGARPGARKESVEQYIKRLEDLEKVATSFKGVEKAWVLEAGREIRVFVKPEEIDDFGAKKLAREIAKKIEETLKYPGMIKVTIIRELRIIEYAK